MSFVFNPFTSTLDIVNSGVSTVASVGSTPNAAGADITGSVLTLEPADGTHPGVLTSGSQTIGGAKTFSSTISASNLSGTNTGDQTITLTSDVTGSGTGSFATTVANIQGTTVSGTTGSGNVVFSTSPTLVTPALGTPSALVGTNISGTASGLTSGNVTTNANLTGVITSVGNATSIASQTGTGTKFVVDTSPTMTNPIVGTQSQGDSSTKAASTSYVDVAVSNAVAGVNPAVAVQAATTSASDTSGFTYTHVAGVGDFFTGSVNTAVTIDGYTFTALGQRLLIKNDTQSPSGAFNGIYYVTQVQTGISAPIFTRALDYDMPSDINNTGAIPVINGTINTTTSWINTAQIVTVGVTPFVFVKFSRNPADYLLVANNLSDVASKSTSFNNLSPMSAQGDVIYGGASGTGTKLAIGTQYQTLQAGATIPAYDAVHLDQTAAVTGILPNTNTTATNANTASAIVARDGSGNFSAGIITAALTGIASGNLLKSTGDIDQTSFSAANNISSATNVTGLLFSNASVRSFEALVSVYVNATASLYESFKLYGIQRGADWQMSATSVGDASGFAFSITTAGQIQYVNNNYTGFSAATVKFRATTTAV